MFIVLEVQTDTTIATIVNSYNDRLEAESRYHQILSSAAVSQVPKHGAVLLTEEGEFIKNEAFIHEVE